MPYAERLDAICQDTVCAVVRLVELIRNVAVDKDVARLTPRHNALRDARVGAADPEDGGVLTDLVALQTVMVTHPELFRVGCIALQELRRRHTTGRHGGGR